MPKKAFSIGCVMCGSPQRLELDLDVDDDVASLGIAMARLLDDGHTVLATDADTYIAAHTIMLASPGLN